MSEPDSVNDPTVVTAIVTSSEGVLLCRRHDGRPEWSFPGGELEDETEAECAIRETAEETGLEVLIGERLGERIHPKTGKRMVYFAAVPDSSDLRTKVGDPDEHSEVEWVPWAQARERLPQLFEPVAEHLERTLGKGPS